MVLHTGSKPDQPVFRTAWMDAKKLSEGDVRRMVMRPQVTPCSEGKLLAIFMPPNGPIHVSNWSRMWWHCRGTAMVAFECDTFLHLILTATARQIAFVAVVSGSEHQGLVIRIELVEYSCIRAVVMHCARALGTQLSKLRNKKHTANNLPMVSQLQ